MSTIKVNFASLNSEYLDPSSIQYKKIRLVNTSISKADSLLDIGVGTGEFIKLNINKFDEICGVDTDKESLKVFMERFKTKKNVHIIESDLKHLNILFLNNQFDYITCLDVLEYIILQKCKTVLQNIYKMTKKFGFFILTGPGIFEKFRILMRVSPTHLYSYSSYGWIKLI